MNYDTQKLTAEENVFAAMLADAVLEYARRNLKKMKRAKRKHEPIPLPLPEEPTPTGCIWIGDRVLLPDGQIRPYGQRPARQSATAPIRQGSPPRQ